MRIENALKKGVFDYFFTFRCFAYFLSTPLPLFCGGGVWVGGGVAFWNIEINTAKTTDPDGKAVTVVNGLITSIV